MTEWPIVQHWKCCVPQGTEGSNPSLSATFRGDRTVASFLCENEETDCKTLVFSVLCGSGIMKIAKNMYFPPKRKRQPFVYERRIAGGILFASVAGIVTGSMISWRKWKCDLSPGQGIFIGICALF